MGSPKRSTRSIEKGDFYKSLNFKEIIPSGKAYTYFNQNADIEFSKTSLFDTVYFKLHHYYDSTSQREIFEIGEATDPLKTSIKVTLKPTLSYPNRAKVGVFSVDSKGKLLGFTGSTWVNGKVTFKTRNFGRYTLAMDTVPPAITMISANTSQLKFKISDEHAGIKNYQCLVNNMWVLMHYDYKRSMIWSEKLDSTQPFKGEVKLIVNDNVNNKTIYTTKIE